MKKLLLAAAAAFLLAAGTAVGRNVENNLLTGNHGEQIMLEGWDKVLWMKNLAYNSVDCHPAEFEGEIVYVKFNEEQTMPVGGTLLDNLDQRLYFNIMPVDDVWGMSTRGWLVSGYQKLIHKGKHVELTLKMCGAAGRVMILDAVKELEKPARK
jgi:hypothetical protein